MQRRLFRILLFIPLAIVFFARDHDQFGMTARLGWFTTPDGSGVRKGDEFMNMDNKPPYLYLWLTARHQKYLK